MRIVPFRFVARAGLVMVVAAGAALAMSGVGAAQGRLGAAGSSQGAGDGRWLQRLDANQDLTVTLEEFLKRRSDRFTRLDFDGDKVLSPMEVARSVSLAGMRRRERLLFGLDDNKDGKISRGEFDRLGSVMGARGAAGERGAGRFSPGLRLVRGWRFEFFDRNGDGTIERSEFEMAQAEQIEFLKRRAMHALDRDGDQKVTLEEFTADERARFMRLDLDRDAKITAADLAPDMRLAWAER